MYIHVVVHRLVKKNKNACWQARCLYGHALQPLLLRSLGSWYPLSSGTTRAQYIYGCSKAPEQWKQLVIYRGWKNYPVMWQLFNKPSNKDPVMKIVSRMTQWKASIAGLLTSFLVLGIPRGSLRFWPWNSPHWGAEHVCIFNPWFFGATFFEAVYMVKWSVWFFGIIIGR